jgi:flagellar motor component MotA
MPGHPPGASQRIPQRRRNMAPMADELDVDAMLNRFRERARAVRQRGLPPLEGAERKRFMDQARTDYMDYAIIGDAIASLEDGILTLRVDLRPKGDGA